VCVCSLSYPVRNAQASYSHLWPARLLQYFSTLFHKRQDMRQRERESKTVTERKMFFWFSAQLLSETFLILRSTERDMIKKMYVGLHVKCRYYC